jgi:DNA polymerase V
VIAIVDINNCFASIEQVFAPKSRNKPCIVLSNNDGACVARSAEAKALGIKMAAPVFELKEIIEREGVIVYSSNYVLYGDMSARVMNTISFIAPAPLEVYSIDECFFSMDGCSQDQCLQIASDIRRTVKQNTGLTVSIGIAPTKVLAKAANKLAKKLPAGIRMLDGYLNIAKALMDFPVEDLWGIGHRYAEKLKRLGVDTALKLRCLPESWIKQNMTVLGLRLHKELHGISCIPIESLTPDRKAIGSAKSFGKPVETFSEMHEALSQYVATCAVKLRNQKNCTSLISVFVQTNFFNKKDKQYSNFRTITITPATNLTSELIKHASFLLRKIFKPGYKYKRVGVLLTGFTPDHVRQGHLFDTKDRAKLSAAQKAIDAINKRHSRDQVRFASMGFERRWQMKQEKLSKRFTTQIEEILTVYV